MKPSNSPFCRICYSVFVRQNPTQIRSPYTGKWIYASDVLDDDVPVFTCEDCGSQDIGFEDE